MNCNEKQSNCTRAKAKPRLGCPDCEYTIQYNMFVKELEDELRTMKGGTRKAGQRWPLKYLLQVVHDVSYQSSLTKTTGRNWTVITTLLVNIYRDERAKIEAVERYNLNQSAQNKAEPEDEGDFN